MVSYFCRKVVIQRLSPKSIKYVYKYFPGEKMEDYAMLLRLIM